MEGIIFKALSGFYYVESGGETFECRGRGRLRLEKSSPLVGDSVEFTKTAEGKGTVDRILPRKNFFVRPAVANVDFLVIIASAVIPVTDPFLVDRLTVTALERGCQPIICINKADLDSADELYEIYKSSGFLTLRTSAITKQGIDELSDAIAGKLCAFTGNSGVGKSTILNALDESFAIKTGDVSVKLGRGRHTTRHVELFRLSNGAIIADTPGFASFDDEASELCPEQELQYSFPEFEPYIGECRFDDCHHLKEPGCAVLEAVGSGKINKSRHASYVRLYEYARSRRKY